MINLFSLENKNILITGASSGIGRAMAIQASQMGAKVIILARNIEKLQQTFTELIGEGHVALSCDVINEEQVNDVIKTIPKLDGVVCNAGVNKRVLCSYLSGNDLDLIFNTNLFAPILFMKKLVRAKKIAKKGSIIFTSSIASQRPSIGNAIYSASKGAIDSYMRVLALELASKEIRVNTIQPGMVWTSFFDESILEKSQYEEDEKRYPLKRYGKPEDIASLAVYLLSDASAWMTGSSIKIDGGISLI